MATYNDLETRFAEFLEAAPDVLRFASLGRTEQSIAARFRVDYLSPSGAIKFYYPDFVAVQRHAGGGLINWILETKGRQFEGTLHKQASIEEWCKKVSAQTGERWQYLRVDQPLFDAGTFKSFDELVRAVRGAVVELPAPLALGG